MQNFKSNLRLNPNNILKLKKIERNAKFRLTCSEEQPRRRFKEYLTIIPRAGMGSESIAHEAEGRMGY